MWRLSDSGLSGKTIMKDIIFESSVWIYSSIFLPLIVSGRSASRERAVLKEDSDYETRLWSSAT